MFRDTTPDLVFELPFDTSLITDAGVTISQHGEEVLIKPLAVLGLDGSKVTASLSRADTRKLSADTAAEVQLWVLKGEESYQSDIFRVPVKRILNVWDDEAAPPEGALVTVTLAADIGNGAVVIDGEGILTAELPAVVQLPAAAKTMTVVGMTEDGYVATRTEIEGKEIERMTLHSFDGLTLEFLASDEPILKNGDKVKVEVLPDAPRLWLFLKIKNSTEAPLPLGLEWVLPGETKMIQAAGTGGQANIFVQSLSIKTLYLYLSGEYFGAADVQNWSITHEGGGTDEIAVAQIYIPDMGPDDVLEISTTPPN